MGKMGNYYWVKYTFSNDLWQFLKQQKINSRAFKDCIASAWDYTITFVETLIREEFIKHYYAKILEKLENYALKTFDKSIEELHSLPRRDFSNSNYSDFLNFGWNPYYYLRIEDLYEGINSNGLSEFSSHRLGKDYDNDIRLFETRDTDEKSLLVIQIFYYVFRDTLEDFSDWAIQKGYKISSFDQLTLNFPEGIPDNMSHIITNSNPKPDGYTIVVHYSDRGEEILRKLRNKTWFDRCFGEAWTFSMRKFHSIIKEYQNEFYLEKILVEIEIVIESLCQKNLSTIKNATLLEDKFFRDYYEFNPEQYMLCCPFGEKLVFEEDESPICDRYGKTLLPNIGLFFMYGDSLTSSGKTHEEKEVMQLFYSSFLETILKLTKWDKEKLDEIMAIETNLNDI